MDADPMELLRNKVREIKESRKDQSIDYKNLTAPCGLPCFECYLYLAQDNAELRTMIAEVSGIAPELAVCKGCRPQNGVSEHLPMSCRVYPCAREKGVKLCSDCNDFPCDYLHPYADQAHVWHNTKVFNLCLIKKMGLERWAKEKAGAVLDVYSYEDWKL